MKLKILMVLAFVGATAFAQRSAQSVRLDTVRALNMPLPATNQLPKGWPQDTLRSVIDTVNSITPKVNKLYTGDEEAGGILPESMLRDSIRYAIENVGSLIDSAKVNSDTVALRFYVGGREYQAQRPVFGSLYINHDSTEADTITVTTAGTFYGGTKWAAGEANLVTTAADSLIVPIAGRYMITMSTSFVSGANRTVEGYVFINNATDQRVGFEKIFEVEAVGSANTAPSDFISLQAGDGIKAKFTSSNNGDTIILRHANLIIYRVGD